MDQFITRHADQVVGVLEGFDRLLFRGTLRSICYSEGMYRFLCAKRVLLKQFGEFAERCTEVLVDHLRQVAARAGRPYQFLRSAGQRKDELARAIAERDGVTEGLVCVLACMESCHGFDVRGDRATRKLRLVCRPRQCRFFYLYYLHRDFGLMHVRIQSWLPCTVQVYLNGRSYLQRQLDRVGVGYAMNGNCFTRIDDLPRAQRLLDRLRIRSWGATLDRLVRPLLRPLLRRGGPLHGVSAPYWSIRQSEYATDVMFADAGALGRLYPALSRHAIERFASRDVLRFLGVKPGGKFNQSVTSDLRHVYGLHQRREGVRIKHRVGKNTIKMYDKAGSVLRIETTINDPKRFRVWRKAQHDPRSTLQWRPMRQGVADTDRRAQVATAANRRYLDALAVVGDPRPTCQVLDPVSQPTRHRHQRCRALQPISPHDAQLFQAVMRGEHLLHGFTNGDLQRHLYPRLPRDHRERRRRSSRVGRLLRLLRAHGLIRKVPARRLYRITPKGHHTMPLALTLRQAQPLRTAA